MGLPAEIDPVTGLELFYTPWSYWDHKAREILWTLYGIRFDDAPMWLVHDTLLYYELEQKHRKAKEGNKSGNGYE